MGLHSLKPHDALRDPAEDGAWPTTIEGYLARTQAWIEAHIANESPLHGYFRAAPLVEKLVKVVEDGDPWAEEEARHLWYLLRWEVYRLMNAIDSVAPRNEVVRCIGEIRSRLRAIAQAEGAAQ